MKRTIARPQTMVRRMVPRKQHGNLPVAATQRRATKSIEGVIQRQGRPSGPLGPEPRRPFSATRLFHLRTGRFAPFRLAMKLLAVLHQPGHQDFEHFRQFGEPPSGSLASRVRCERWHTPPRMPASRWTSVLRSPRVAARFAGWPSGLRKQRSTWPTPFDMASIPSFPCHPGRDLAVSGAVASRASRRMLRRPQMPQTRRGKPLRETCR